MKKRKKRSIDIGATTTAKDWGLGPVAGKGGKTRNSEVGDTMIHRELKEACKKQAGDCHTSLRTGSQ